MSNTQDCCTDAHRPRPLPSHPNGALVYAARSPPSHRLCEECASLVDHQDRIRVLGMTYSNIQKVGACGLTKAAQRNVARVANQMPRYQLSLP